MRRLNLGQMIDCENRLQREFIDFAKLWREVKEDWTDTKRDQFEREHLSTLGPSLSRFSASMSDFCDLARKAERALADDREPS